MSDDITFCINECANKTCFRNPANIKDRAIPHSFSSLKDTEDCPDNKRVSVPCEIEPTFTEEQAIAKLYETDWLPRHDQELVRGIIKRIADHGKVVVDNNAITSTIGKECYIMAHDHISAMLKKEWGIDG